LKKAQLPGSEISKSVVIKPEGFIRYFLKGYEMKKVKRTLDDYKDIINKPHHVSDCRPQMKTSNRAAQFAPFAAVVGHDVAIKETARLTENRKELDEMEKNIVDGKLREIEAWFPEKHEVKIIYFEPDIAKTGGRYISKAGVVKKIDKYTREVLFDDATKIDIEDIYSVEL